MSKIEAIDACDVKILGNLSDDLIYKMFEIPVVESKTVSDLEKFLSELPIGSEIKEFEKWECFVELSYERFIVYFARKTGNKSYNSISKNSNYFRDEVSARKWLASKFEYAVKKEAEKIAEKESKKEVLKNTPNGFKVGDVFHHSYGYDMTINNFIQITSVSASGGFKCRAIGSEKVEETGYLNWKVKPAVNSFSSEEFSVRLTSSVYSGKASFYLSYKGDSFSKVADVNKTWYENHCD